ncbi:MAG: metal-dependent hydrolase [Desulfovibrionaceae bacterium]
MPGYKAHIITAGAVAGGSLYGLAYFDYFHADPMVMAVLVAICLMAALFPDVDTCSVGRKLFYGLLAGTDVVLMVNGEYEWAAILGFFAMLPAIDNHRGWTHTWWGALLVPLPIIALPMFFYKFDWQPLLPFYVAAVVGYFSHLALDKAA